MTRKLLQIFILLLLAVYACKKKTEDTPVVAPKPADLLPSASWHIYTLKLELPTGSTPSDITNLTYKACELDDKIDFGTNGSYSCKENTNVCSSNASGFYALDGGTWGLSGDTLLAIAKGFNNQVFKITKTSSSTIEMIQTQHNYLGDEETYRFTLKKF